MSPSPIENLRLKRAYDLISDKLARVEEELLLHFRSPIPTIDRIGTTSRRAAASGSARPCCCCRRGCSTTTRGTRTSATRRSIEFIHTATLVHDDIIDEARLRRGRTSANARWGNNLTVLFGDYLYTMSMGIALDEGDLTILKVLSDTTLSMIEGEIIGIEKEGSIHVTREEALEITRRKTADLFSAACRLPAHFAPRGDLVAAERLGEYGRCLGMAFQLIDDLLDYTGSDRGGREARLERPARGQADDAAASRPSEGAPPPSARRSPPCCASATSRACEPAEILSIVDRYDGILETRALARDYAGAARVALGAFPDSEAKDGLLLATESVIDRIR